MSNVTTIHAALKASLAATFPNKTVIPNPFELNQNNANLLKDGYGFYYGPSGLPDFDLGVHFQGYGREFNVVLTENVYRTDNDATVYETAQLSLLEDQNTLIGAFSDITSLDRNLVLLEFVSDGGIEFIFGEKNNYLALTTNFAVAYKEDKSYCIT